MEGSSGVTTIERAIAECHDIFHKVKLFYKDADENNPVVCRELHKRIVEEHRDFAGCYPIVIRMMVYEKFFHAKVMKNYLVHISHNPWHSMDEFLERQAEYVVYVERHRKPRTSQKDIAKFREYVIAMLKKENEDFNKLNKEVTEELNKEQDSVKEERRKALYERLKANLEKE